MSNFINFDSICGELVGKTIQKVECQEKDRWIIFYFTDGSHLPVRSGLLGNDEYNAIVTMDGIFSSEQPCSVTSEE